MKYVSALNVLHDDIIICFFVASLELRQKKWLTHSCNLRSILSSTRLIEKFLKCWGPATQNLQDTFQALKDSLYRYGFPVDDETVVKECETEKEHRPPFVEKVLEEYVHEDKFV
jgi:hypothetical protein